jgi:cell filamentation protein, protein adenylyltransferase
MSFDPGQPYNDLPALPPAGEIETRAVLKKSGRAASSLAALQQAAELIPNQEVLINSIPLREAKDSSAIENIVTTNDRLFRFANVDAEAADPATKETLRYRTALLEGYQDIRTRPLTTRTATTICRAIKGIDLDIRRTPGTTLRSNLTGNVIYSPPEGEALLRDKMSNWENFLHQHHDIEPVVRMAIGHYQFEAIHPFPDGNGRTGRIINILFLIEQGLLDQPILYLSRYINQHREDYYRLLLEVTTKGAWEPWILYMLEAVENTAMWTRAKIKAIKLLMEESVRHVAATRPKIYSRELIEVIFVQPYCRINDLVQRGIGTRKTAAKYLGDLVSAGVLQERKEGREKLYINTRFLDLLMTDNNQVVPYEARAVQE